MRILAFCRWAAVLLAAALPAAAQPWAKENLEKSSRHQEWVKIQSGSRDLHAFVVFPEIKDKAPAVIVIHENRGLTDWVRSVADQLAAAGYLAIAPDLLSGMAPGGGRTSDFGSEDKAREAIYQLSPQQVTADLNATAAYIAKLPAANGAVAVSGFCWGGAQTFRYATDNPNIKAAFVFYGTGPEDESVLKSIHAPVYGFYGGNDARVNATIPKSQESMQKLAKKYEPKIYEGAGHGFMRSGEQPEAEEANRKARDEAWARWKSLLKKI